MRRGAIVDEALGWIGTPYRHQASLKGVGCDCLGLVRGVWRAVAGPEPWRLPTYSREWGEAGDGTALGEGLARFLVPRPLDAGVPGDVLLFRWRHDAPAKHLGLLVAPERLVHAHAGAAVARVGLGPWRRRLAGVFSFPGVED